MSHCVTECRANMWVVVVVVIAMVEWAEKSVFPLAGCLTTHHPQTPPVTLPVLCLACRPMPRAHPQPAVVRWRGAPPLLRTCWG